MLRECTPIKFYSIYKIYTRLNRFEVTLTTATLSEIYRALQRWASLLIFVKFTQNVLILSFFYSQEMVCLTAVILNLATCAHPVLSEVDTALPLTIFAIRIYDTKIESISRSRLPYFNLHLEFVKTLGRTLPDYICIKSAS